MGIKLGGPSLRELRRQDAQRLNGLEGPQLRAALVETTWKPPRQWSGLVFWIVALVCVWLLAWDCLWWAFTGRQQIFDVAGPPGPIGWVAIVFLTIVAVVVTAVVAPLLIQRRWVRLDARGITHREQSILWRPPVVYRWAECGPFKVRHVPTDEGQLSYVVQGTYSDGTFALDGEYGDARDLVAILNAYRAAYRSVEGDPTDEAPAPGRTQKPSLAVLRRREAHRLEGLTGPALRDALEESTWTQSRAGWFVPLAVFGGCGAVIAALFATSTGDTDAATWAMIAGILVLIGIGLAFIVVRIVNPPWVRLDSTGIAVGGARALRPSPPPAFYRWEECGPFALHTISGENARTVVRCTYGQREFKVESTFGDPLDLVTILNAYRSVYGSTEYRQ